MKASVAALVCVCALFIVPIATMPYSASISETASYSERQQVFEVARNVTLPSEPDAVRFPNARLLIPNKTNDTILTVGTDLHVLDASKKTTLKIRLPSAAGALVSAAWNHDGSLVAAVFEEILSASVENVQAADTHGHQITRRVFGGVVCVYDLKAEALLMCIRHPGSPRISDVKFTEDNRHIVTGATDGTVYVWDFARGNRKKKVAGIGEGTVRLGVSMNGKWLAVGSWSGKVQLLETGSWCVKAALELPNDSIVNLAFAVNDWVLLSCRSGSVKVFDVQTQEFLQYFDEYKNGTGYALAISKDGTTVVSGGGDGFRACVHKFAGMDGEDLATEGELFLWSLETGKTICKTKRLGTVWSAAFSSKSNQLVLTHDDGTLKVLSVESIAAENER